MPARLRCVDCVKPIVTRVFVFDNETFVWDLCEKCTPLPAFSNFVSETKCLE